MMISPSLRMALHLNACFRLFLLPNQRFSSNGSLKYRKIWKHSMSLRAKAVISDGVLRINGKEALKGVPENVVITPSTKASTFLGAVSPERSCRHIFKLGVLEDYRLLCLFRFKIWWMIPRMGNSGSDIPVETQMLLLEAKAESVIDKESHQVSDDTSFYILFLPVLDGEFRSSLQGNSENELEFCMESGDPAVAASQFLEAVFVNYGDNPFNLLEESMKILEKHKGNFSHRSSKKIPEMLDWFGWCTWDAFYTEVNPRGIEHGLKSLSEGGTPARFLIIDDGWQDTVNEFVKEGEPSIEGSQFGARLVSIKENKKFHRTADTDPRGKTYDLNDFVSTIKRTFGLKYVYVWHALMGYWGGVDPNAPGTKKYNSKLLYPVQSPGNLANIRDIAMDSLEKYGVGTIDPAKAYEFYDDLHSYLVSQNVDGVKVDVQSVMETLGTGFGGRVLLTRLFQQALEKSVARNFQDNSIICCMAHNTDSVYSLKASAITRASDDYMPRNQTTQTLHVATVAFNSLFFGEIVIPDWDMFYSCHYAAEFHAVARAVGGCGVYVSDKPGQHDFTILKRLVLPDGSVLRANYPGRPTRDCLFNDPVMDGKSLLKVWNLNNFSGVLGIFNCQGAGTWPFLDTSQSYTSSEQSYLTGHVSPIDIEFLDEVTGENCTSDCAVFCFKTGSLHHLVKKGSVDVSLKVLECDIFTISPVRVQANASTAVLKKSPYLKKIRLLWSCLDPSRLHCINFTCDCLPAIGCGRKNTHSQAYDKKVQFAPIGLIDMYNSGGAVEAVDFVSDHSQCRLDIKGRGSGQFGAYSSIKPKFSIVNSEEADFEFNGKDKFLKLVIPPKNNSWVISIHFEA